MFEDGCHTCGATDGRMLNEDGVLTCGPCLARRAAFAITKEALDYAARVIKERDAALAEVARLRAKYGAHDAL
jgi:hypothetical protein